jgi:hypothetical protein
MQEGPVGLLVTAQLAQEDPETEVNADVGRIQAQGLAVCGGRLPRTARTGTANTSIIDVSATVGWVILHTPALGPPNLWRPRPQDTR